MLPLSKGRIAYLGRESSARSRIIAEFERIYAASAEDQQEDMALLDHYVNEDQQGLSVTPECIPCCASLFTIGEWVEYDSARPFGAVGWVAGDARLKCLASTFFVSV